MTQIKEIDVVNSFYNLNISAKYARDPDRIAKGLVDILADFGLKNIHFGPLQPWICVWKCIWF